MPEIGARHGPTHENGGNDEINITGLDGAVGLDDTPVDGQTAEGITSNWAYDHAANKDAHHAVFVDRGDPAAIDFDDTSLTDDTAWHDLDLSGIVPAGAIAVLLRFDSSIASVGNTFQVRKNGNANAINTGILRTQVSANRIAGDLICALDANRVIEYYFDGNTWNYISLVVRGWWI